LTTDPLLSESKAARIVLNNWLHPDLDSSGLVNTVDFFGYFRPCFSTVTASKPECRSSDFDGNGVVNEDDFYAHFLPQFGKAPGPGFEPNLLNANAATAIPSLGPTHLGSLAALLLATGLVGLAVRRRTH